MAFMRDSYGKKIENLDERSDQVKEILGRTPNWMIRWGISVVFVIVALLILGASVISYNNVVSAKILITSKSPSVRLNTNTAGKLAQIYVKDKQYIKEGQVLVEIDNSVPFKEAEILRQKLEDFVPSIMSLDSLNDKFPINTNLGSLQSAYSEFLKVYQDFIIYKSKNISQGQSDELEKQFRYRLLIACQNLNTELTTWREKYIISSPIDGRVFAFDNWKRYQNVKIGEELYAVIPDHSGEIIGKVSLSTHISGKVKTGQKVLIKLFNYPFEEWGSLQGTVIGISEIAVQKDDYAYLINVQIQGLTTSIGKKIPFKYELHGSAEIVVEELTVLQRILYQLFRV